MLSSELAAFAAEVTRMKLHSVTRTEHKEVYKTLTEDPALSEWPAIGIDNINANEKKN